MNSDIKKAINTEYVYPSYDDPHFQSKIQKKREFYYHSKQERGELKEYQEIEKFRDRICGEKKEFKLLSQQALLSNFMNPDTPYKGILIFHGTGVGKTCAGIAIAERYKPLIKKYNTKIYILVSGPLIREQWKDELLFCTGETYLKKQDDTQYIREASKEKLRKDAIANALQYYKFMSYKSFYRKILGEKITERVKTDNNKIKKVYRKNEDGEYERDVGIDRITSLDNSLIIVDEAHSLTDNSYGEALLKLKKNSKNLSIVLMTATPMKNRADDIIELLNFIRPEDDPLKRDKIFNSEISYKMDFKPGGIEYLKKMATGYVSYLKGADPLTFAKRVDKGVIPEGLLFTKVIRCKMLPFQLETYNDAVAIANDALDRKVGSVSNFVFPGLDESRKVLQGYYGNAGLESVKSQLSTYSASINKKVSTLLNLKDENENLVVLSDDQRGISGDMFKFRYLKNFSVKFYKALKKVKRLIWSKKGARTAFVYCNLVKTGIELFTEVLKVNGYLEYDENPKNYNIGEDTLCYFCGNTYKDHKEDELRAKLSRQKGVSESSTEYIFKRDKAPEHVFHPATYISVTGKITEEAEEVLQEDKMRIIRNVFNNIHNKNGKDIKLVLGSQVMTEGISLYNVAEVHILDAYYNLGKIDQVIGRAIRHCSHYNIMSKDNVFPKVNVYKYVVSLDKGLSTEENLYRKAEYKYRLVKKVERVLKKAAIDCALNKAGNVFPEELSKYKNCVEPGEKLKKGDVMCPATCDYTNCDYQCYDTKIKKGKLKKEELDYTTFGSNLARIEIEDVKNKIKQMYRFKYVYTLKEIVTTIKDQYDDEKRDLFDEFFVFKALDELVPITENDFNNYADTIFDKFNNPGYLIYINRYYIFQPFNQNENVPMYYRSKWGKKISNKSTLINYIKNTDYFKEFNKKHKTSVSIKTGKRKTYDFESVMDYYNSRKEYKYVGIIDKESLRKKNKTFDELEDVFKLREKRGKLIEKKRAAGIPSIKGAVCATSKEKAYLNKVAKDIGIKISDIKREAICEKIKDRLLHLEKYATGEDKLTYIMIPANHKIYEFPYNLEDRVEYIIKKIKEKIKFKLNISKVHDKKDKSYKIIIKYDKRLDEFKDYFKTELKANIDGKDYIINIK